MNSMLRQHHLRMPDIKPFLRSFERHLPTSQDEWAAKESKLFAPGCLIFCLEPVAAPAGLSSFSKKGEESGETYRVKDFCVVVSNDDNVSMVVNITASAFEFRTLDSLMVEKARKSILDGRDFIYVSARPTQKLDKAGEKALYELASNYAQGGSRRSLTVEGSSMAEPAYALLAHLGANVATVNQQAAKTVMDIGTVCHMIITPEGRQEDKTKQLLRTSFNPIKAEDLGQAAQPGAPVPNAAQGAYSTDPAAMFYGQGADLGAIVSAAPDPAELAAQAPAPAPYQFEEPAPIPAPLPAPQVESGPGAIPELPSYVNMGGPVPFNPTTSLSNIPSPIMDPNYGQAIPQPAAMPNPTASQTNMPPAPMPNPTASQAGMSALPPAPLPSPTASQTNLQASALPPAPLPISPTASQAGMPSISPVQARSSQTNLPAARMVAPEWYKLSHDLVPIGSLSTATEAAPKLASALTAPFEPESKQDFASQFLSDFQQGLAGSEAVEYAEKQSLKEKFLKEEQEQGKAQRLRDYFGDEHYDKFIDEGASTSSTARPEKWELKESEYAMPKVDETASFDSEIFADAGRSTLETNPDAVVPEPVKAPEPISEPEPVAPTPSAEPAPLENSWMSQIKPGEALTSPQPADDETVAPSSVPSYMANIDFSTHDEVMQQAASAGESSQWTSLDPALETQAAAEEIIAPAIEPLVDMSPAPKSEPEIKDELDTKIEAPLPRVRPRDYSSPLKMNKPGSEIQPRRAPLASPQAGGTLSSAGASASATPQPPAEPVAAKPDPVIEAVDPEPIVIEPEAIPETIPEGIEEETAAPEPTPEPAPEPAPEQTPEPAPEPTPEPTPEPAPEPTPEPAPEPAPADDPLLVPVQAQVQAPTPAPVLSAPVLSAPTLPTPPITASANDGRLMQNEMTTLMAKLEQQVSKAANKISSRAEELKNRLTKQVDTLLKEAHEMEKQAESNLSSLLSELNSKLDNLADEVKTTILKEATVAQDTLDSGAKEGIEYLESEKKYLSGQILRTCKDFREEMETISTAMHQKLDELISTRNKELSSLRQSVMEELSDGFDHYTGTVEQRFSRFKERMAEETASVSRSLERNMRSMVEEIESSLERACEKLNSTRLDLERSISHTVASSEASIARTTKKILAEQITPKLNEQKIILRTMIADMSKQINDETTKGLSEEAKRLEVSTSRAAQELKSIVEQCFEDYESAGGGLRTGLDETYKRFNHDINQRVQEVHNYIKETEKRVAESETILRALADASSVDAEPELQEERANALTSLQSLKHDANRKLAASIEDGITSLEEKSESLFDELTNKRQEATTQVRDSAEANLEKIRQALQEATEAIQKAREKHME